MNRKSFVLMLVVFGICLGWLATVGALGTIAEALVGVLLVLFLPGYALTLAVFPERKLGGLETLCFSGGLSLASTALGGLLLNRTPWGLQTGSWLVYFALVIVGAAGIGLARRGSVPVIALPPLRKGSKSLPYAGIPLALAALVLGAAIQVAATGAARQPQPGFTQLWMVPVTATQASPLTVRLGISNREADTTAYRVQLSRQGKLMRTWERITLAPNATWQTTVRVPAGVPAHGTLEATLYRLQAPQSIYRRVWIQHE